jgi:nucleoid-associated protein YgaU
MAAVLAAALFVLPALLDRKTPVVAPTPPPTARAESTPNQAAGPRASGRRFETYLVRRGDTLRLIAVRVYGDEELWRRIFDANRRLLASPADLVPGMELRIPVSR